MRSGLLTILSMIGLVWNVFAQVQPDEAKYELLRETINFLATDKTVSQDTNFRISCQTLDYSCFKQQLSSKPIAGIERWYNSWESMNVADEATFIALRNQVFADIFERPGKGYRKQLGGYEGYIARVERLMDQPTDEMPMDPIADDTLSDPILSPDDSRTAQPDLFTGQNETPKKENTMIAYFAIAIAIIALVIAALPVFKQKERQHHDAFQDLRRRLNQLAEQLERLEMKAATDGQIKDAIASLTDIMEAVEKRVVELENKSE